jgi:hypothetical protein
MRWPREKFRGQNLSKRFSRKITDLDILPSMYRDLACRVKTTLFAKLKTIIITKPRHLEALSQGVCITIQLNWFSVKMVEA